MGSDIELFLQIATGSVILMLQGINLWRSLSNGRGIKRTNHTMHTLHDGLRKTVIDEIASMRISLDRTQALVEGRTYGRRATDYPQRRRADDAAPAPAPEAPPTFTPPQPGGISPRDSSPWPING